MLGPEVQLRRRRLQGVQDQVLDADGYPRPELVHDLGGRARQVHLLEILERPLVPMIAVKARRCSARAFARSSVGTRWRKFSCANVNVPGSRPAASSAGRISARSSAICDGRDVGRAIHPSEATIRRSTAGASDGPLRGGRVRELPASGAPQAQRRAHRRADLHVPQLVEPALVGHGLAGEQPAYDRDRLVGAPAPLRPPLPDGLELPVIPARSHAQDVALVGEGLEGRDLLGQDDRMAGRQDKDRGAQAEPRRRRRHVGERDDRVEPRDRVEPALVQQVIGRPDGVKAQVLGAPRERRELCSRCARWPRRTWAGTRPLPRRPTRGDPPSLSAPSTRSQASLEQRTQRRTDVGFVDHPQAHERMLDASAVVADGRGEDRVAQRLEHVAELERAGEIMVARGLVHLDLLARGERAEAEQRALGPEEIRLEQEVVVAVQDGGAATAGTSPAARSPRTASRQRTPP